MESPFKINNRKNISIDDDDAQSNNNSSLTLIHSPNVLLLNSKRPNFNYLESAIHLKSKNMKLDRLKNYTAHR